MRHSLSFLILKEIVTPLKIIFNKKVVPILQQHEFHSHKNKHHLYYFTAKRHINTLQEENSLLTGPQIVLLKIFYDKLFLKFTQNFLPKAQL